MKRGFFWNYFEPNDAPGPYVKQDMADPCPPFRPKEDNGWLIYFYYYERRISIEAFHALADGFGALTFFRTLLAVYLRELGHSIPNECGILDVDQPPDPEELEDASARYATVKAHSNGWQRTAYPNVGTAEPFYTLNVTMGFLPVDRLKAVAKTYGASITEYLAAVLIQVILDKQRAERPHRPKPVALAIPINLRPWFPSKTLRNFILTVRPSIDPALGEYTLAEIVSQVHHYMRLNINRQQMHANLAGFVQFQNNKLLQLIPGVLKNPVVDLSYTLVGTRPFTATYTNPGSFTVPAEMERHIERMEIILGQATKPKVHCASMSYGNIMNITFAGNLKETDTEREFFRLLVREGISVRVESNRV